MLTVISYHHIFIVLEYCSIKPDYDNTIKIQLKEIIINKITLSVDKKSLMERLTQDLGSTRSASARRRGSDRIESRLITAS